MLALDLLANGLIYGCFYALMAVGLAIIFGVLKIVNFAHGEFFMIGAYTYVLVALKLGVSPWLALPGAALAGALLGWVVERVLMRPLYQGYASWGFMKDEYAVVVTDGVKDLTGAPMTPGRSCANSTIASASSQLPSKSLL